MQAWICNVLSCYKNLDQDMMNYVQAIFTYLWTIWNHRNLVLHEGKDPNPMEVILTVQISYVGFRWLLAAQACREEDLCSILVHTRTLKDLGIC